MGLFAFAKRKKSEMQAAALRLADIERHKNTVSYLTERAKNLFIPPRAGRVESFEEAVARHQLSSEQVAALAYHYKQLAYMCLILSIMVLSYALFHFYHGHFQGALVSCSLVSILATFAFRYHFWYTQIKCQRLGLSWSEWLQSLLGGKS